MAARSLDGVAALAPDVIGAAGGARGARAGAEPGRRARAARSAGTTCSRRRRAWGGGHEGLAIVSRFPIGAHEARPLPHSTETEGRISCRRASTRDAPAAPFWVHTTHLSLPRDTRAASARTRCCSSTRSSPRTRNDNVQVVMGDFNAVPDSDEIRWLTGHDDARRPAGRLPGRLGARERGAARRTCGVTWASANPYIVGMHWLRPDRRLDYIFVTPRAARWPRRPSTARASSSTSRARRRPASACSCRTTSASSPTCRWSRSRPHATPVIAAGCSCWRT